MTGMLDMIAPEVPATGVTASSASVGLAAPSPSSDATATPSVLWKAFDVLGAFMDSRHELTLSELARRSGLPKSTTHRILAMLVEVKAVERGAQGYRMGLRMFAMGACSPEVDLRNIALPHLERLRHMTKQTVHLAVLDGHDAIYLEKLVTQAAGPGTQASPAVVGGRLPAHATGVGKVLLAFGDQSPSSLPAGQELIGRTTATITSRSQLVQQLRHIREVGYALDREEAVKGLACVAAPVLVREHVVAAISVAYNSAAGSGQVLLTPAREIAGAIGRALMKSGYTWFDAS